ncbi:hypothetical protein K435DRAFT_743723 [Dendrothele bispora CBS 962.96]|uniref:FAM86 N-terminal domain-containing protein n=1 Tax=Dendrothele bispora (strain CBS 962.96) TaxID=1314807 RepID=A0A4S8MTS6_DENBC|nr:hypothetical protein K435DRAFT_743723 [Dendrothele bispora CBS 962.96]
MHKDLFLILKQYASLVPPRSLTIPNHFPLSTINEFLVAYIITNPHFHQYPPAKQFQQQWWKRVISLLEEHISDQEDEIDPRIFDYYLSLLSSYGPPPTGSPQPGMGNQICARGIPLRETPSKSFITHFWKLSPLNVASDEVATRLDDPDEINLKDYQTITLHESLNLIESGTTGLRTWPASHRLGQYLINHPDLVRNARILELGSGIGFLGIILATLQKLNDSSGAAQNRDRCIWLTDVNEDVLSQCHRNLQLDCNLSSTYSAVHYRTLDWSDALSPDTIPLTKLLQDEIDPNLVLGTDIVFDPSLVPPLAALLGLVLRSGSGSEKVINHNDSTTTSNLREKLALIALTVRNRETFELFLQAIKDQGLSVEDVDIDVDVGSENEMFLDSMRGTDEAKSDVRTLSIKST